MENPLDLSHESFTNLIGDAFVANKEEGTEIELTLSDVGEQKTSEVQTSFSVVFTASPDVTAEPGVYKIHHQTEGEAEIFLSPFWADADSVKLEAIFNSLN